MKQCGTTLSRALTLSLAVHAAVFGSALAFAHYGGVFSGDALRSITVSLVGAGSGGGAGRRAEPRPPVDQTPAPAAEGHVARTADDAGPDERSAQTPGSAEPAAPSTSGSGGGAAEAQATGAPSSAAAGGAEGGIRGDQLQYLQSAIEKAKTYPRLARERGIEGTVLVRFKVLPTGDVETVDVVRSSGAQILDDASVRTVYRAAPMPYVNGWVEVPMVYELK
jgi:protein TonB